MYLTVSNLAGYLVRRGLVPLASVVDGDLHISQSSRRNRNFVVRRPTGGWFIKQVASEDPRAAANLRREAAFYRAVDANQRLTTLAPFLPRLIDYDVERSTLVVECVRDARQFSELHAGEPGSRIDAAGQIAEALAACHGIDVVGLFDDAAGGMFRKQIPGVLRHGAGLETPPPHFNAASLSLLQTLRGDSRFTTGFRGLIDGWRRDTLIHGDLRWENCLFEHVGWAVPTGPQLIAVGTAHPTTTTRLRLVDWEEVDLGDAAWDVGGALQGYLLCDLLAKHGIPIAGPAVDTKAEGGRRKAESGQGPLALENQRSEIGGRRSKWGARREAIRPPTSVLRPPVPTLDSLEIAVFWQTYVEARGLDPATATDLLERSIACAAAWLVQSAVERASMTNQLIDCLRDMLDIARNILAAPARFARETLRLC